MRASYLLRTGVLAALIGGAVASSACNRPDGRPRLRTRAKTLRHEVSIHHPTQLSRIRLSSATPGDSDQKGDPSVACVTCHSLRADSAQARTLPQSMTELTRFHQGLSFRHGEQSCASCHEHGTLPTLHLADGRALPLSEAMQLCQQCHGPQYRDYRHGSHGGMTGHWDLSMGPRERNHCVDCHDPHAPAIRPVVPARGPRDRFYGRANGEQAHHGGEKTR